MRGNPFWWLNEESQSMLERGYLLPNQTVQEKLDIICSYAATILGKLELKEQFYNMFSRGWASLSSPIWANFGESRGLPISCFSSYVADDVDHIFSTLHDVAMMTKNGGGTAGHFSSIRAKGSTVSGGGTASGLMSFLEPFDSTIKNVSQAGVRRGGFAAYCDINHPEILDFLKIKDKTHSIQTLNTAVCIDDKFMQEMIAGDDKKREVWAEVLRSRREKGIPYLFFTDTANRNKPDVYKDRDMMINGSNLCNEIMLHTSADQSLVCCLSSMNVYLYDEWKDTNAVELLTFFLDAVIEDFINKTKGRSGFTRAHKFAKESRAIGVGVLGLHSYYQLHNVAFDSIEAQIMNHDIFKDISEKTKAASAKLAKLYGEPELLKGYGRRNVTTMAIAPTTSSASLLGQTSPSVEPYKSNFYTVGLAKGSFVRKNKSLEKLLKSKGKDTREVWDSIMSQQGSVQHLDFLTEDEKNVFRTFSEINPMTIIQQASVRQKFIDQGQSLNLMIPNSMSIKEINQIHIKAWELGLKGLYYQRGTSVSKEALAKMLECSSCSA